MRSTNYWTGVAIIVATSVALAALLVGRQSSDSPAHSTTQAVVSEPTGAADGLPEVVVTAARIRPGTITMSERNTNSEPDRASLRHHR
jgi:hypothetical protein